MKVLVFSLLLTVFASVPAAAAAPEPVTLQGTVAAAAPERPLAGASVSLVELQRRTLTDRGGRFRFARVPPGTHTLRVELQGFAPREERITVTASQLAPLTLVLEPSAFEIAEVIATASPLGSPVTYQPAQAFGQEALQRRASTSLGEMLDGEPGLAMRSFGAVTARPVIRGLDGDRVLVLENGERMGDLQETAADHAITLDPLATDRVEVVRGPASLLYGSSALGGVVNLFNDDLPRQWAPGASGNLALQAATVNGLAAAFGRFVYGDERWGATGRFSYRSSGDQRTPEGLLPATHSRVVSGSAGLGYLRPGVDAGLAIGFHDHGYGIPDTPDDADQDVEIRTARRTLQARANWERSGFVENLQLRLHAARFEQQEVEIVRRFGTLMGEYVPLEFQQRTLSSTLTLRHARLGLVERGAVGFSVFGRGLDVGGYDAFTPGAGSASLAVFPFPEVPLTPAVRLQVGGRVENQWLRPRASDRFVAVGRARTIRNLSGAVGLSVRPAEGFELGAQLARAHRTPTVEELFADGPHLGAGSYEVGDPSLAAEIGHGADFFARWTDARTRLEIAGFVNRIANFIIFQPTGEVEERSALPMFRYEGADAQLFGGEAVLETLLIAALRARLGADYVRGSRRDALTTPLPFMPPPRGRVGVTYEPRRGWLGAETRLVARQNRVAPDEPPTPGYALLQLDAGYRLDPAGRHLLTLRLDNALNAAYRDHLSRVEDRDSPMPGRSLNVVYRWRF